MKPRVLLLAAVLVAASAAHAQDLQKMTKDATKATQQADKAVQDAGKTGANAAGSVQQVATSAGDVDKTLKFLTKNLGLNKDQKGKVNGILKKLVPGTADAMSAASKGVGATVKEKGDRVIKEISGVLTPTQNTVFSGLKNETLKMLKLQ